MGLNKKHQYRGNKKCRGCVAKDVIKETANGVVKMEVNRNQSKRD
jgi:hypothetical protein